MMETYYGYVRTPADAIKLFEACRLGLLPRVQRRLSEKERQSIRSGSVFVWDEREAGMRRWTDGKSWSASRVSGSFLTYREMEGKRGGAFGNTRRGTGKTPDSSGRGSDEDQDDGEPDGYRYKADGLMKQSFSITTAAGQHLHLICYYSRPQPGQPELPQPTTDPSLRHIVPLKGMYPESSMNETPVPAMTRTPMQQPPQAYMPPPPQQAMVHPYPQYMQQHPGYQQWPPSSMASPYGQHYAVPAPYPSHVPPHHQHAAYGPAPPMPAYGPPPPQQHPYDRAPPSLPPPAQQQQQQQQQQQPLPPPGPPRSTPPNMSPYTHHQQYPGHQMPPHPSNAQAQVSGSPQPAQHLQAHAAQAMIDPRLAAVSARNPQGLLPAIGSAVSSAPTPAMAAPAGTPIAPMQGTSTPPPQQYQQMQKPPSPLRDSNQDTTPNVNGSAGGGNKASLSALLLHPASANSESTNGANPPGNNSANSSPRQGGSGGASGSQQQQQTQSTASGGAGGGQGGVGKGRPFGEDVRAISVLDKKFCL